MCLTLTFIHQQWPSKIKYFTSGQLKKKVTWRLSLDSTVLTGNIDLFAHLTPKSWLLILAIQIFLFCTILFFSSIEKIYLHTSTALSVFKVSDAVRAVSNIFTLKKKDTIPIKTFSVTKEFQSARMSASSVLVSNQYKKEAKPNQTGIPRLALLLKICKMHKMKT